MSDYTPTTADVRGAYIQSFRKPRDWSETQPLLAEFNRWLTTVKAEALREAADKLEAGHHPPETDELYWDAYVGYYGEVDWMRALANEMETDA